MDFFLEMYKAFCHTSILNRTFSQWALYLLSYPYSSLLSLETCEGESGPWLGLIRVWDSLRGYVYRSEYILGYIARTSSKAFHSRWAANTQNRQIKW